ncbi:oligosaccharide flippase family protein [Pseudooceanicola marinus]|uniref:oligosaccharide flippase family protein n=1 Tax=Pseudooceanicola marinus TaxID=396013 RepID=UPI001CD6AF75|nr:oligosaccharide flippase family protein [Pseudooceanicola marinus]MCA1338156.1 oligosaccharide flippase family protein [Pseudooceanicola marinus]
MSEQNGTAPQQPPASLWKFARSGVFWSLIKSWGSRFLTFFISIILARLLSPEEFGIAQTSALVLSFVPLVAEFGFGASIIQRRNLKDYEANLPFFATLAVGLVLLLAVVTFAEPLQAWVRGSETSATTGNDLSLYISLAAGTVLVSLPTLFQEAFYKKHMKFKELALRQMVCHFLGGIAAVAAAFAGFGIWSFLIQIYIASVTSAIWLWRRPQWLPSTRIDVPAFTRMARFGLPIVGQRFNDFFGTRLIDVLIISQSGLAAYGLYAVGSRLYLLMLQLLQRALYDVSLSVLSQVSHDRARIGGVYMKTIALSSHVMSPIFVMVAVLSPEIMLFLFGDKWLGIESIATPLLLLGAVQCVQHMNGAFLTARGKPSLVLVTGITKTVLTVAGLLLLPAHTVESMTMVFVICQALVAPLSFAMSWRELGVSALDLARTLLQATLLCVLAFGAVVLARPLVDPWFSWALPQALVLGMVFSAVYISALLLVDPGKIAMLRDMVDQGRQKKKKAR